MKRCCQKAIFSSRRGELQENERRSLEAQLGETLVVAPLKKLVVWHSTEDGDRDRVANRQTWEDLGAEVGTGGMVLGDFPHAALEALPKIPDYRATFTVWVRIYEIGSGGFLRRDAKFLRWGRIF